MRLAIAFVAGVVGLALAGCGMVHDEASDGAAVTPPATTRTSGSDRATAPSVQALVGQRILARMEGSRPSRAFLARISRGQIGGVILFGNNIPPQGPKALVETLQQAARRGGQPPLLIATDQEGGVVRRFAGPPTVAPDRMGSTAVARGQGLATGRYLRALGINVNLAPVLDVPSVPGAFIASRTFSTSPSVVAARGVAFAQGLAGGGIVATAKHFPGLGGAVTNTDTGRSVVGLSKAALLRDLAPFRAAVKTRVPMVMVSTAVYPALGSRQPAALSPSIVDGLLRRTLGFQGVVISDDVATAGVTTTVPLSQAIVAAAGAGVDLVYAAGPTGRGSEAVSANAYTALLAAARAGRVDRTALLQSYRRIIALKQRLRD